MNKVRTIIRKEWAEIFRNRMVLFSVIFLPLIMTAIPIGILWGMGSEGGLETMDSALPQEMNAFCPEGLAGGECFQVYLVSQFMLLFMILPLIIPATIAAYSVVGEKTSRTLEPLLATPISTTELLLAKSLAALLPAVGATFLAFGVFAVAAWLLTGGLQGQPNLGLLRALLDARWLAAIFITGPLLALMAVNFGVMVSSRVSDPRVAEQISSLVVLPLMFLFFGQMTGLFVINRQVIWALSAALLVIDAILVYLSAQVFQRETILTRWK